MGPSGVHVRASLVATVPAVEEHVQKLYNITASIELVKDATNISWKISASRQIHHLLTTTTILQTRTKTVPTKKIPGTFPLKKFQPHISVTVSAIFRMNEFNSGTLCLIMGVAVSLVSKKWC